jgi:hypothetical protein
MAAKCAIPMLLMPNHDTKTSSENIAGWYPKFDDPLTDSARNRIGNTLQSFAKL